MIKLTVRSWSDYNPRKDYKTPRWFALSNRVLEDPFFYALTPEELKAWIYILCQCSQKNSCKAVIILEHAERVCRISEKTFISLIKKLQVFDIIENVQMPNVSVQETNVTEQNREEQNKTEQNIHVDQEPTVVGPSVLSEKLHLVGELWNANCGKLAKVKSTSGRRNARCVALKKQFPVEQLITAITKIAASDFCNGGGSTGWKANFDWFIKPDTVLKAIEGNYDGKPKTALGLDRKTHFTRETNEQEAFDKMMEGIHAEIASEVKP